jgi:Dolichyl-phosphate-mannose-protein mannosyltransferase
MQHAGPVVVEKSEEAAGSIASSGWPTGNWNDAASRGLIIGVAFVLAWLTWAHWGDVQIDCGRELYVPTEILRGKLLYRDIFYPYGPLAPYAGALLISLFGPSLNAFYLFGLAVAIGCALLLFEIGAMLDGRGIGLTAALALLFEAFSPSLFNFVFPYAYAATMGLFLSLLCAFFALRYVLRKSIYELILAGVAAGVAMLCKQEFGTACYLMLAAVVLMEAGFERSLRTGLHAIAACSVGAVLWIIIYGWFFWTLTPAFMINANWIGAPGTYSMRVYAPLLYAEMGQRLEPSELAMIAVADISCLLLWFYIAKVSIRRPAAALAIALMFAALFHFRPFKLVASLIWAALVFPRGMFLIGCAFVAYAAYELFHNPPSVDG